MGSSATGEGWGVFQKIGWHAVWSHQPVCPIDRIVYKNGAWCWQVLLHEPTRPAILSGILHCSADGVFADRRTRKGYRMSADKRPLSPHLQFTNPMTSVMSTIRTGRRESRCPPEQCCSSGGSWPRPVGGTIRHGAGLHGSWFGYLVLFGFTYCVMYHLCNGIRHLFWDAGYGFELETAQVRLGDGLRIDWATVLAWLIAFAAN